MSVFYADRLYVFHHLPKQENSIKSEESTPKARGRYFCCLMDTSYGIINVRLYSLKIHNQTILFQKFLSMPCR